MPKKDEVHDVVIIGGGIAAHTAALYTARARLNPVIITAPEPDQLSLTTVVENYPGFPEGIMGPDLIEKCKKQAERFGAKYVEAFATAFRQEKGIYIIEADGKTFKARTVIISTGASARKLGIPGEDKYFGRGVSTCAVCDAALFKDKIAVVVGGGDSAMEETLALYKFAKKVYIVHRRREFRASKIMQERVMKLKDKVSIVWESDVTEVVGDGKFVKGVKVKNVNTSKESTLACDGMFLAIGHIPNTKIFKGVKLDDHGYVIATSGAKTNLPGVFAAGDVRDPVFKQAVTSAGTGCMAAIEAERYIENLKATGKYK